MRFVEHHQVPLVARHVIGLVGGKLVGGDDDLAIHSEGLALAGLDLLPIGARFQDDGGEGEFFLEFLRPLLAQAGRHDQQDAAPVLGPALRDDQAGFDRLSQPNLVCKQHAVGDRGREGKEGRINLMRVEVYASGGERPGKSVVRHALKRQAMGQILAVVGGVGRHRVGSG